MLRPLHLTVAIIEPDSSLQFPYSYLPKEYTTFKFDSFTKGYRAAKDGFTADLFMISANIPTSKLLDILDELVASARNKLPAIILTVNLEKKLTTVPGIKWNRQLRVLSTNCSELELAATLSQLFPITFPL